MNKTFGWLLTALATLYVAAKVPPVGLVVSWLLAIVIVCGPIVWAAWFLSSRFRVVRK